MTSEEREAAITLMTKDRKVRARNNVVPQQGPLPLDWVAEQFLDALLTGFVVIAKGDVIWVCKHHGADVDHLMLHDGRACAHIAEDGSYCRTRLARTHWEPTTTPEAFA